MDSGSYTYTTKGKDRYIMPKSGKHTETVIFLHGLGDSADGGWFDYFFSVHSTPCLATTKTILLNAPNATVTINMGAKMASWFDIRDLNPKPETFEASTGIDEVIKNTERIHAVLKEEIEALGGDSTRVILSGFSQGAMMSLYAGLGFEKTLGGIIGWSGYLFPITIVHEANAKTPLLLANGMSDPLINCALSDLSYKKLDTEKHSVVRIKEAGLGHTINDNISKKTAIFMRKVFNKE